MFESNPYAMVGVAMIEELHLTISEKAEAAEQESTQPRWTWRRRLSGAVLNLWAGRGATRPYTNDCDQAEIGCI